MPRAEAQPAAARVSERCGFTALIGAPNVGKSTLANRLVGAKVSIVSHKAQTTRAPIRGIFIAEESQVILVDTPGLFAPKRRLDRAMVRAALEGAGEADLIVLLIDAAKGIDEATDAIFGQMEGAKSPIFVALNKIDRAEKPELLRLADEASRRVAAREVFMISALDGAGVGDLKSSIAQAMPEGPWLYPEDQLTDAPMRQAAAEITREKLFHRLHDELPYASTVETTDWKTLANGSVRVEQTIYVERDSQRKILLGEKGRTIKEISMSARRDLQQLMDEPVHLFLFVKVRQGWGEDPARYREMGLQFPDS